MKGVRIKLTRKKVGILFILMILAIAFFEIAFMYEFDPSKIKVTHDLNQRSLPIFFLIAAFAYIPCFLLGYARLNILLGAIPPFLLNGLFWILLIYRAERSEMDILGIEENLVYFATGLSLLSGFFGILITYISSRIFDKYGKKIDQLWEMKKKGS